AGKFLADFTPGVPTSTELFSLQGQVDALPPGDADRDALAAELQGLREERAGAVIWLSVAMAMVALVYTMVSGLYGVVWTDVFQAFIIGGAAIFIGYTAFTLITPELLAN